MSTKNLTLTDKDKNEITLYVAEASEVECKNAPARFNFRYDNKDYAVPAIKDVGKDLLVASSSSSSTPIYSYYGTTTLPTLNFLKNNTTYYCVHSIKSKITNTFSYVANGGTGSAVQKVIVGNLNGDNADTGYTFLTASDVNFSRQYYNFVGWRYNNSTDVSFGQKIYNKNLNGTKDPVIYAHWVEYYYTLNYNANGGSGSMNSSQHNYSQSYSLSPNTFTKTGYSFDHWTLNSTSGTSYKDEATVSRLTTTDKGSVTMYAIWKAITYNIKYTLNGGSLSGQATTYTIESATYTPPTPTKTGATFLGWTPDSIPVGSIGDKTFTANWKWTDYNITYNANGGAGGGGPSIYHYNDTTATKPSSNPTRNGYTFAGWTPANIPTGSIGDKTFTANWTANSYSITYSNVPSNADNSSNPTTYKTGDAKTLNNITRSYYTFNGWTPSNAIKSDEYGNKTFTANWTPISYNITYNLNDGTISGQKTSYTVETATYTPPAPTKTGYTFNSWSPASIPKGSSGDKTFTASWNANRYVIRYKPGNGSGSEQTQNCTYDSNATLKDAIFTKSGWTQTGWSYNDTTYALNSTVKNLTATNNKYLDFTAVYTANTLYPSISNAYITNVKYGDWYYGSWGDYSNGSWGTRYRSVNRNWTATIVVTVTGGVSDNPAVVTLIDTGYGSWSGNKSLYGTSETISISISGSTNVSYITVNAFRSSKNSSSKSVYVNLGGYYTDSDYKSEPSSSSSSG